MAAILTVQALFFADGGLLALGCNIFNMGFFSCLVAYPFIYRPLAGTKTGTGRITLASVIAAVIGLQMGLSPSFWKQRPPASQPCPSPNLLN